jgi:hypothetical protein
MSLNIPSNVINIIFEYYAQMNDLQWAPFVDLKTGETKNRVNKYSTKYDDINKLLEHRKKNLVNNIKITVEIMHYGEIIDRYYAKGTCICLKIEDISDYRNNIKIFDSYIEFIDKYNNKYCVFYSTIGRCVLRNKYDIYQDGNIHSTLINYENFDNKHYLLTLEKF